jgi:hypothetical protein
MRSTARRVAIVLAAPALTISALAATSSPASAAADPAPAAASAAWLTSQLTGGLIHNNGEFAFDDIGLSADVAFGLAAVGGNDATVDDIVAAIAPRAQADWYTSTYQGVTTTYAGSLAKAATLAETTGGDPTDFGGQDLISMLEATVSVTPPTTGRVEDVNNDFSDTNTLGQAYAAQALAEQGSASAVPVTTFLVQQQCADGWFRLDFAERTATDQTCDGDAASVPDTDATAIALMAMVSMHNDALVPAIGKAEAWLLSTQHKNGAWGGGPTTEAPNANSTGLAGWALGELGGDDSAVANAAAWVRAHQATNVANCVYYDAADLGAIAYDNAALKTLQGTPVDPATTQDQFRRAASQALPVLQWAPAGSGDPQVLFTAEYVKAGGKKPVGVIQATPGEALCAMLGEQSVLRYANADGVAHLPVLIPAKTATSRVKVANAGGTLGTAVINALGAKKLPVKIKDRVAIGRKQTVKVTGLAPGEMVTVSVDWPRKGGGGSGEVTGGQANRKGVFFASFKVPNVSKGTVKVTGQFANRKASKTFTVTR